MHGASAVSARALKVEDGKGNIEKRGGIPDRDVQEDSNMRKDHDRDEEAPAGSELQLFYPDAGKAEIEDETAMSPAKLHMQVELAAMRK